jgi:hypothetical protein
MEQKWGRRRRRMGPTCLLACLLSELCVDDDDRHHRASRVEEHQQKKKNPKGLLLLLLQAHIYIHTYIAVFCSSRIILLIRSIKRHETEDNNHRTIQETTNNSRKGYTAVVWML